MFSLIMVNTWRGLPFYAITLLAGLQTISPELYEAATIDGAGRWAASATFTLPLLKPIIFIVTMFSVIFTFADFQADLRPDPRGRPVQRMSSPPMPSTSPWVPASLARAPRSRSPWCRLLP